MTRKTPIERAAEPAQTAIVYQGELDYLSRCILDYPDIETGGELFGFWTASGIPVVLYAIGPGPRANHEVAFFNQDLDYLRRVGEALIGTFGLQHIGEWHSHHRLGLAKPSGHDARTMVRSIEANGLGRFLLCIGNLEGGRSTVNAFSFHQAAGYDHCHAAWDVKEGASPYREVVDRALAGVLEHPRTASPDMGALLLAGRAEQLVTPDYGADYWLNRKENNLALKRMLDFLAEAGPLSRCAPMLDADNRVVVEVDRPDRFETILFPARFPLEPPELRLRPSRDDARPLSVLARLFGAKGRVAEGPAPDAAAPAPPVSDAPAAPDWTYTGDVVQAFTAWYRHAVPPSGPTAPSPTQEPPTA